MGTRTIFQVLDSDRNLIATLFSNSSHTTQFAEGVFEKTVKDGANCDGPNALIERLLPMRYETEEGGHKKGDRIFWLVPADEAEWGDREAIVKVVNGSRTWTFERLEFEKLPD